jgi:hypothetical protein
MRAGGLRNRVTIRTFTSSRTPSGQVIQKWEDGETIWAEVKGISGRELVPLALRLPKPLSVYGFAFAAILPPQTA